MASKGKIEAAAYLRTRAMTRNLSLLRRTRPASLINDFHPSRRGSPHPEWPGRSLQSHPGARGCSGAMYGSPWTDSGQLVQGLFDKLPAPLNENLADLPKIVGVRGAHLRLSFRYTCPGSSSPSRSKARCTAGRSAMRRAWAVQFGRSPAMLK